jgi:ribosomal protein L40E
MENGYIITPAIRWSKEKHTQVAFGQEVIVPWQLTAIPNIEAYRCTKCRLVLFHYPIPTAEITPDSFVKKCVRCGERIPIASECCPKCGAKQKVSSHE